MCDKMAISAYILKIVEKDRFLRLQMRAKVLSLPLAFFHFRNSCFKKLVKKFFPVSNID